MIAMKRLRPSSIGGHGTIVFALCSPRLPSGGLINFPIVRRDRGPAPAVAYGSSASTFYGSLAATRSFGNTLPALGLVQIKAFSLEGFLGSIAFEAFVRMQSHAIGDDNGRL